MASGSSQLNITLQPDMAGLVKGAVETGDYASASDVVREALRDWGAKRALKLENLRADIDKGLADLAHGRLREFDSGRIISRGRGLSARLTSA